MILYEIPFKQPTLFLGYNKHSITTSILWDFLQIKISFFKRISSIINKNNFIKMR